MGWLGDSSMRAVKPGEFQQYLLASPEYLRRAGRPELPQELADSEWVALSLLQTSLAWKFSARDGSSQAVQVKSRIRVDAISALRAILREGGGISVLDEYSVKDELRSGRLVRLVEEWSLPPGGISAVYPPGRQVSVKARDFTEFYREYLFTTERAAARKKSMSLTPRNSISML